jgi:hypothetical protein
MTNEEVIEELNEIEKMLAEVCDKAEVEWKKHTEICSELMWVGSHLLGLKNKLLLSSLAISKSAAKRKWYMGGVAEGQKELLEKIEQDILGILVRHKTNASLQNALRKYFHQK